MNRFHVLIALMLSVTAAVSGEDNKPSLKVAVSHDFLALHVSGRVPPTTTEVQYRWADRGAVPQDSPWLVAGTNLSSEGAYSFDVKLDTSRWSALEVRAMRGDDVLTTKEVKSAPRSLTLLTKERLTGLPEESHRAWTSYLQKSRDQHDLDYDVIAAECRALKLTAANPAPGNAEELEFDSDTPTLYFASAEALKLAETAISYQTPSGGWSKSVDYRQGPRPQGTHWTTNAENPWHYCGTIDNRSTTEQIKLLAGLFNAGQHAAVGTALQRGIDYLFLAQYPNGGWPQNYPVEEGYHEAITLNDNAMVHVLEVLLAIAEKSDPFAFADDALRTRARTAFDRGIACLAAAQVRVTGQLTVWCAQHDPLSLAPVQARAKEPPSLSGSESAELVRFLMRKAPITPESTKMIEAALAWFDQHRITGLRRTKNAAGKTDYVPAADSKEVYWARFYDVQTGRPMFAGAQDGVVYASFSEMAAKNKVAYDYFTTKPQELITKEVPRWRKRLAKATK